MSVITTLVYSFSTSFSTCTLSLFMKRNTRSRDLLFTTATYSILQHLSSGHDSLFCLPTDDAKSHRLFLSVGDASAGVRRRAQATRSRVPFHKGQQCTCMCIVFAHMPSTDERQFAAHRQRNNRNFKIKNGDRKNAREPTAHKHRRCRDSGRHADAQTSL